MAKVKNAIGTLKHEPMVKKTSTSGKRSMVKFASMNKKKKANYKAYRGQGR